MLDEHVKLILHVSDFFILKKRYAEILACLPEKFEATVNVLQEVLDPSQLWEILSATSGHNHKILNALIMRIKSREDMLDFFDNLEKIPDTPPLLTLLIEQLRKGILQCTCTICAPKIMTPRLCMSCYL